MSLDWIVLALAIFSVVLNGYQFCTVTLPRWRVKS
jgi:hypothetical protein